MLVIVWDTTTPPPATGNRSRIGSAGDVDKEGGFDMASKGEEIETTCLDAWQGHVGDVM
jgi:hypothetical protein